MSRSHASSSLNKYQQAQDLKRRMAKDRMKQSIDSQLKAQQYQEATARYNNLREDYQMRLAKARYQQERKEQQAQAKRDRLYAQLKNKVTTAVKGQQYKLRPPESEVVVPAVSLYDPNSPIMMKTSDVKRKRRMPPPPMQIADRNGNVRTVYMVGSPMPIHDPLQQSNIRPALNKSVHYSYNPSPDLTGQRRFQSLSPELSGNSTIQPILTFDRSGRVR